MECGARYVCQPSFGGMHLLFAYLRSMCKHGFPSLQMCARDQSAFDYNVAKTLCRQLRLPLPGRLVGVGAFGAGAGPVLIDSLGCWNSEEKVNECEYTLNKAECGHEGDVGLICNAPPGTPSCWTPVRDISPFS